MEITGFAFSCACKGKDTVNSRNSNGEDMFFTIDCQSPCKSREHVGMGFFILYYFVEI